jgi:hypothetical protein
MEQAESSFDGGVPPSALGLAAVCVDVAVLVAVAVLVPAMHFKQA